MFAAVKIGDNYLNVSEVTDMSFKGASVESVVSSAITMDDMFVNAQSFKQKFCGAASVQSKESKRGMFTDSPGSISRTVCTSVTNESTQRQYVSRRSMPERELIARTSISTSISTPSITSKIDGTITERCCEPGLGLDPLVCGQSFRCFSPTRLSRSPCVARRATKSASGARSHRKSN